MFALVKILDLATGNNKVCYNVNEIRNLQIDDVNFNKKYKVWYEGCYRDAQILAIKESKQDVEDLATKSRFTGAPKRNLESTSEVTDEEVMKKKMKKDQLQNTDSEKVLKQLVGFYKKKYSDLQDKNQIFEEKLVLLQSKNEQLEEKNAELQNRIRETTEKYFELETESSGVIEANNVIKDLRKQLADKVAEIAQLKMMNKPSKAIENRTSIIYKEGKDKTTGHVEDNLMYMGFNWWIPKNIYDMTKHNVKTPSAFVSNLCVAVFGIDVLKRSTITGNKSNRSQHNAATPEKLDSGKVFAIRDCVRFWLQSETNLDKIEIEKTVEKTRFYIARKISELKVGL